MTKMASILVQPGFPKKAYKTENKPQNKNKTQQKKCHNPFLKLWNLIIIRTLKGLESSQNDHGKQVLASPVGIHPVAQGP